MKPLAELVVPAKSAVLVVDVQNDYCHPDGALGKAGLPTGAAMDMLPNLQRLLAAARAGGTPVIFIKTTHTPETDSESWTWRSAGISGGVCRQDTWGAEFTEVAPTDDEPVVIKHRYSAFINTRLDSVLRTLKIENLIMTGVSTNICVESTARHGYMLDYHIVFLSDCTAAYTPEEHEGALYNMRTHFGVVATADDVIAAWNEALVAVSG
ncbi:MAG: isochorismatase family cysteine hydrolase [Candidatus Lustribacter sp.]|jgi:ureidoacrylate peracid hydrolase